jgi:glycerol-3-phosphate acyltransferase PlsX
VVAGAAAAARAGTRCVVFGPLSEIERSLGAQRPRGLELVDAPDSIANDDEPARAARSMTGASVVQAAQAVTVGRAEAMVSAGSTGGTLAASLLHVKRMQGVFRPAIAVPLPLPGGTVVLLDAGANVEVRPEHLVQFAHMGAAFSERVLGVDRPRVGLLSVGEEAGKGTETVVEAHRRLSGGGLEFAGNVEGDDLPQAAVDVVVTDGFTGNVALKLMEGTSRSLTGAIAQAARSGPLSALGGLLLKPKLSKLRDRIDPERVGGAYLLGLRRLVVICHGRSSRRAIENAIGLAARGVEQRVVERTAEALAASGALRGAREEVPDQASRASASADSLELPR